MDRGPWICDINAEAVVIIIHATSRQKSLVT